MDTNVVRTFIPGSPWLYYKIYAGTTTAKLILTQLIKPFTEQLCERGVLQEWFFIRYHDPDPHLRLRFLVKEPNHIGAIILQMQQQLQPYLDQELVWKLQLDTYNRELERYGTSSIEQAETLFYHDSMLVTNALDLIEDSSLKLFFVLKRIDQLLTDFNLTTVDKLRLVQHNGQSFKKEFNTDKHTNKQLDRMYRKNRADLEGFMVLKDTHETYAPLLQLLQNTSKQSQEVIQLLLTKQTEQALDVSIENLLGSYIHMFINRFYDARQRLHELVSYDFLDRYYRGVVGRERSGKQ